MTKGDKARYTAYSIIYGFHDRDNICFTWYVRNRSSIAGPSPGKGSPNHDDRLFTREELDILRDYLARHHETELFVQKQEPPFSGTDLDRIPEGETPVEAGTGFYMLSEEEQYDLPFEVRAYYDLNGCPLTHDARARQEERRHGVSFIRKALQCLDIHPGTGDAAIDAVVERLYDEFGYKVEMTAKKPGDVEKGP